MKNEEYHTYCSKNHLLFKPASFEGRLVGGNLLILAGLLGTKFEPNVEGKVLFLEEVGSSPQKLHFLLLHLYFAKIFKKIRAVIFGKMENSGDYLPLLRDFVRRYVSVPVLCELDIGHGRDVIPLKIGGKVKFDAKNALLCFS
ncbi:hypothetical protein D6783_04020 [Candidatus Woesearchaeota archaeon]|nr:MAG: hypothetical protein D6783_04020 [Candidatus Woesearchaeota archaeon]